MNTKELMTFIGKEGTTNLNGLLVGVRILDVKNQYGRIRYQVTPIVGSREIWVESISINE